MLRLVIGNKNYSSWSMRPWVLLRQAGIEFEEVLLRFDSFAPDSQFKKAIAQYSPVGRVPVLLMDDFAVWDTLAIAETLAEKFPLKNLWPADANARARARSVCAEMHSGFTALRSHCPNNIEARLPHIGQLLLRDNAGVRADVARIETIWTELLRQHGGPFLFGKQFTIPDAYYAPVAMRFTTYGLSQNPQVNAYIAHLSAAPGVAAWIADALAEREFLEIEEPYRLGR